MKTLVGKAFEAGIAMAIDQNVDVFRKAIAVSKGVGKATVRCAVLAEKVILQHKVEVATLVGDVVRDIGYEILREAEHGGLTLGPKNRAEVEQVAAEQVTKARRWFEVQVEALEGHAPANRKRQPPQEPQEPQEPPRGTGVPIERAERLSYPDPTQKELRYLALCTGLLACYQDRITPEAYRAAFHYFKTQKDLPQQDVKGVCDFLRNKGVLLPEALFGGDSKESPAASFDAE
jgi:peptidyl-tRNA hydrolase